MRTLTPDQVRAAAATIAGARLAIGVATLATPRLAAGYAGVDRADGTSRALLGLFGIREVVVGLGTLERVRAGYPSSTLLRLNALLDAGDAAVIATSARHGRGIGRLALSLPVAVSVAAAWAILANQIDEA